MKLSTIAWKAIPALAIIVGLAQPAFAAKIPTTGGDDATCLWGDASFEDGCANATAAADAKANELARLARARKATLKVAAVPPCPGSSGNDAYSKRVANGAGN